MIDTTRRTYLRGVGSVSLLGAVAGCLGDGDGGGTGTLATQVTDQPGDIADFESCVVTVVGAWLGTADAEAGDETGEEPSEREYLEYEEPQTADLVQLQGDSTQLVDERELDVETYELLQLDTDGIDATLEDGSDATVEVPGNAPLTFTQQFEIREDTRTTFTADFTPVRRGEAEGYVLQPVAQGTTVEYQEVDGEEGSE